MHRGIQGKHPIDMAGSCHLSIKLYIYGRFEHNKGGCTYNRMYNLPFTSDAVVEGECARLEQSSREL